MTTTATATATVGIDAAFYAELLRQAAIGVSGMGLLAAVTAAVVTSGYRWLTTRKPPSGTAVFVGLSAVTGSLTVTAITAGSVLEGVPLDHQASAGYLLATITVAGVVGVAGGRLGDRAARQVLGLPHIDASGEAASTIRAARLAIELEIPDSLEDADGYRPVTPVTRRALSGASIRLPHGLSGAQRRDRIERHLLQEYDIGYADVTMAADGSIDRVTVGRRPTGLGSLLASQTVAVAIHADPLPDASVGDSIEIRSTGRGRTPSNDCTADEDRRRVDDPGRLVATGTLRTMTGAIATVVVDADRADALSPDERYRLVARPDGPTDSYEFAATIRASDETVTTLTVESDGPLAGEFVGWLPGRVLVIDRDGDSIELPDDNRTLRAGDELWLLATPDVLATFDPASADDHAVETPSPLS